MLLPTENSDKRELLNMLQAETTDFVGSPCTAVREYTPRIPRLYTVVQLFGIHPPQGLGVCHHRNWSNQRATEGDQKKPLALPHDATDIRGRNDTQNADRTLLVPDGSKSTVNLKCATFAPLCAKTTG